MADLKISQLTGATTPLAGTEVLPIVQSNTTKKVATDDLTVKNIRSNATTGILQVAGPAAAATRTMTVPDANFTVARTDAGQTFTGVQVMTSPNIVTSINDTNGNELIGITATASAVNEITVANAATGNNPVVSATGADTNIGITLTPKGTGNVTLTSGNLVVANGNGIDFSLTPGTGTSELLADYEEGTWTPSQGAGLAVVGTFSSSGTYTKIGRTVILNGFVAGSTSIDCTSFGVICGSLPFAAMAGSVVSSGVAWTPTPSTGAAYISTTTGNLLSVEAFAATTIINFTISFTV